MRHGRLGGFVVVGGRGMEGGIGELEKIDAGGRRGMMGLG